MSYSDFIAEESEAEERWNRVHPPKGSTFVLRGLTYAVVRTEPLTMVGPSGKKRRVPADVLERMTPTKEER